MKSIKGKRLTFEEKPQNPAQLRFGLQLYDTTVTIAGGRRLSASVGEHRDGTARWIVSYSRNRNKDVGDGFGFTVVGAFKEKDGGLTAAVDAAERAVRDVERFLSTRAGMTRQEFLNHCEREGIDLEEARRVARAFKDRFPELDAFMEKKTCIPPNPK